MAHRGDARKRRGNLVVGILIVAFLVVLAVPSLMGWLGSLADGSETLPEPSPPLCDVSLQRAL